MQPLPACPVPSRSRQEVGATERPISGYERAPISATGGTALDTSVHLGPSDMFVLMSSGSISTSMLTGLLPLRSCRLTAATATSTVLALVGVGKA
jgi:hypothetical protein